MKSFCFTLFGSRIAAMLWFLLLVLCVIYLIAYITWSIRSLCAKQNVVDVVKNQCKIALSIIQGTREYQQDSVQVQTLMQQDEQEYIAVLCDGMGGMSDGGRASEYCTNACIEAFCEPRAFRFTPNLMLETAIRLDKEVADFVNEDDERINSGTTLVAALVRNGAMHWVSVGDSRIYVYTRGRLYQVTRDHNYVMTLTEYLSQGMITQEDFETNPMREALISYLGKGDIDLIDTSVEPIQLLSGDVVMLCSDGVTKLLDNLEIERILSENLHQGADVLASLIIEKSVAARVSSQDNTSVAIIKI